MSPRLLILLLLLPSAARAHHGQDFLVTLDAGVPRPGHFTAFASFEWSKSGDTDELSLEPGFMAGLLPGLALGTSFRLADEGPGGWDYTAVDPQLQWTLPTGDLPVSFAFSAGYAFADGSAAHGHAGAVHQHVDDGGGIDPGPDGPPPGADTGGHVHLHDHGHSHGGIHRHGEDHFHFRFIADTNLGESTRLVLNLIGVAPGSGEVDFGYSFGIRQRLSHDWAVGLENIGDFNRHGENELIAGLYWTPVHDCTVRLGLGAGIGAASTDFSVRSGITWRF